MDYKKLSEENLLKLVKNDDKKAENEIVERYKELVRSVAKSYYLSGGDMDDIVQTGMIGVYNAAKTFDGKSGFKTYVYLCVKREILSLIRRYNAKKQLPLGNSLSLDSSVFSEIGATFLPVDPETEIINSESEEELFGSIKNNLSEFEFKIFSLYYDGYSYAEISAAIGKDEKSVDNALQRIRKKSDIIYGGLK